MEDRGAQNAGLSKGEFNEHGFVPTFAGMLGNVLEWYDFAVFASFSDVLSEVFFPSDKSGRLALVETLAISGVAFLARPIGGAFIGYIGDLRGRKRALVISMFLMAVTTFVMGVLPSYKVAGGWAIALITLTRLGQGLAVGGELAASIVFTCENHRPGHWGFYGALVISTANAGFLLGSLMAFVLRSVLSDEQLVDWGWRLPFLVGSAVGITGVWIRNGVLENQVSPIQQDGDTSTIDLEQLREEKPQRVRNPIFMAFSKGNLRALFGCFLVMIAASGAFYILFAWLAIYMTDLITKPVPNAFGINAATLLLFLIFCPFAGLASDRWGRRPIMTAGCVAVAVSSPFLVDAVGRGETSIALGAQAALSIFLVLFHAVLYSWLVESFDPAIRLTSIALSYNLAEAVAGSSSPTIATMMVDSVGPMAPGYLLSGLVVLAAVSMWLVAPYHPKSPASSVPGYERITWSTLPGRGKKKEQPSDGTDNESTVEV